MFKKQRENVNNKVWQILLACAILGILVALLFNAGGEKYNAERDGATARIDWEYVNVRTNPDESSTKVGTLSCGATVTLTGNSYSYLGGEGLATENWTQISYNGGSYWIVSSAIDAFTIT